MSTQDRRIASISVDLDSAGCYHAIHGLKPSEKPDPIYEVGIPRMLDFLQEQTVRATLFAVGRDLESDRNAGVLKEAAQRGHEIGNHSYAHDYTLRNRSMFEISKDFQDAEEAIFTVTGSHPVGYRTPGYNVDGSILKTCIERGYLYDSSVFPCPPYYFAKAVVMGTMRLFGIKSRSAMTRPETLLAPIQPYQPDSLDFWRPGELEILEIPMAVLPGTRFPIIGTSLHLLGHRGFDVVWEVLKRSHTHLNLEFHAIDFMDENDPGMRLLRHKQPDLKVPWAKKKALYGHVFSAVNQWYSVRTLEEMANSLNSAPK